MSEHCRCNVYYNGYFLVYREMARRNDCIIVDALEEVANVTEQVNKSQYGCVNEICGLRKF